MSCIDCHLEPCGCFGQTEDVTISLSQQERIAIIAWIREDESPWVMQTVVPVMKRLVGGG